MSSIPPFFPGRRLAMLFYSEAVRPLLERRFPHLKHGAGFSAMAQTRSS
ncbi:MAG: hypothetical protein ACR2IK_22520 [Chloroflexota bacterium]